MSRTIYEAPSASLYLTGMVGPAGPSERRQVEVGVRDDDGCFATTRLSLAVQELAEGRAALRAFRLFGGFGVRS